jgi:hypothetical protein
MLDQMVDSYNAWDFPLFNGCAGIGVRIHKATDGREALAKDVTAAIQTVVCHLRELYRVGRHACWFRGAIAFVAQGCIE